MPWEITSTRPALRPSASNPRRKSEKFFIIAKNINELMAAVSKESIDADRIVIIYITDEEYIERKGI